MPNVARLTRTLPLGGLLILLALDASAQSFRVQCPTSTAMHASDTSAPYTGPALAPGLSASGASNGVAVNYLGNGGGIKCQQVAGGDGYATMADGHPVYLFGFGPLSGLSDIVAGKPGTQTASIFMQSNLDSGGNVLSEIAIGAPTVDPANPYMFNGAIGVVPDVGAEQVGQVSFVIDAATELPITGTRYKATDKVNLLGGGSGATAHITAVTGTGAIVAIQVDNPGAGYTSVPLVTITSATGSGAQPVASLMAASSLTGHVDERLIMDVGVMNASQPAPLMAIDEDDEFFLTLTNVGMIMRPDLFEQHTIHFHGYPNASSFYDGVPDATVAISIGASFTYYYLAPDAGTYFWHCHISPPEHLQMGMVGQLYVKPRQNRVPTSTPLLTAYNWQQQDLRTQCGNDVLCSTPKPAVDTGAKQGAARSTKPELAAQTYKQYAYNDGDGSTAYDVEYPIQMHGFDPNFHFVGMTFNPESFTDMKDKYFLLNGRSYPDTVAPGPMQTPSTDGTMHASQPLPTIINVPAGGRALLRISDLNVTEYHTLATLGIPMHVIALNARLLRDLAGNDMSYYANSITLAGGESLDVMLDASDGIYQPGQKYYLYTPQLDHLANDAENFGGMMTEINICKSDYATTKVCN